MHDACVIIEPWRARCTQPYPASGEVVSITSNHDPGLQSRNVIVVPTSSLLNLPEALGLLCLLSLLS